MLICKGVNVEFITLYAMRKSWHHLSYKPQTPCISRRHSCDRGAANPARAIAKPCSEPLGHTDRTKETLSKVGVNESQMPFDRHDFLIDNKNAVGHLLYYALYSIIWKLSRIHLMIIIE